ncbi:MAG: hypothetical protein RL385_349 [Pseudomonadota bacterium]|jgi:hypothetical protein
MPAQRMSPRTGRVHAAPDWLAAEPQLPAQEEDASRLASLGRTPELERLLYEAEQQAVAECMKKRGFSYTRVPYDGDSTRDELAFERVSADDVEAASALGYELASTLEQAPEGGAPVATDPSRKLPPAELARYDAALFGPEPGALDVRRDPKVVTLTTSDGLTLGWHRDACISVARRAVFGDDDVALRKLELAREDLLNELEQRAARSPLHTAAVERWRICMRARGHTFDAPGQPANMLADDFREGRLNLEQLRDRERELATEDARCAREAGVRGALESARETEGRALARAHGDLIERWQRSDDAARMRVASMHVPDEPEDES